MIQTWLRKATPAKQNKSNIESEHATNLTSRKFETLHFQYVFKSSKSQAHAKFDLTEIRRQRVPLLGTGPGSFCKTDRLPIECDDASSVAS
jgi:hypothetical protein